MNRVEQFQSQERRVNPRHLADLRVQLIRGDVLPMQVHTVELSKNGMHIECDREQTQLLAPPDIGAGQQFTARIVLSASGAGRRTLTLSVVVKSVIELGYDHYRVGLQFMRFFGKSSQNLDEFVAAMGA